MNNMGESGRQTAVLPGLLQVDAVEVLTGEYGEDLVELCLAEYAYD